MGRGEIGEVCLEHGNFACDDTLDRVKGGGRAPSPSPGWADFTIGIRL
jgi:hypothetical protein